MTVAVIHARLLRPVAIDPSLFPSAVAVRAWDCDPSLDQADVLPEWREALWAFGTVWSAPRQLSPHFFGSIAFFGALVVVAMVVASAVLALLGQVALKSRIAGASPSLDVGARDVLVHIASWQFVLSSGGSGAAIALLITLLPSPLNAFDVSQTPGPCAILMGSAIGGALAAIRGAPVLARALLRARANDASDIGACIRCGYALVGGPGSECSECGLARAGFLSPDSGLRVLGALGWIAVRPRRAGLCACIGLAILLLLAVSNLCMIAKTGRGFGAFARSSPFQRQVTSMPGVIVPLGCAVNVITGDFEGTVVARETFGAMVVEFADRRHEGIGRASVTVPSGSGQHARIADRFDVGVEARQRGAVVWFPGKLCSAKPVREHTGN